MQFFLHVQSRKCRSDKIKISGFWKYFKLKEKAHETTLEKVI